MKDLRKDMHARNVHVQEKRSPFNIQFVTQILLFTCRHTFCLSIPSHMSVICYSRFDFADVKPKRNEGACESREEVTTSKILPTLDWSWSSCDWAAAISVSRARASAQLAFRRALFSARVAALKGRLTVYFTLRIVSMKGAKVPKLIWVARFAWLGLIDLSDLGC